MCDVGRHDVRRELTPHWCPTRCRSSPAGRSSPTAGSRRASSSSRGSTSSTSQRSPCSTPTRGARRCTATTTRTSSSPRRSAPGIVIDTPTWRASLDWGARQGYDAEAMADINRRAVRFVADIADRWPAVPAVVNGAIGPRGDGYVVGQRDVDRRGDAVPRHADRCVRGGRSGDGHRRHHELRRGGDRHQPCAATARASPWPSRSPSRPTGASRPVSRSVRRSSRSMPTPSGRRPTSW
jgi:hypothetical protein